MRTVELSVLILWWSRLPCYLETDYRASLYPFLVPLSQPKRRVIAGSGVLPCIPTFRARPASHLRMCCARTRQMQSSRSVCPKMVFTRKLFETGGGRARGGPGLRNLAAIPQEGGRRDLARGSLRHSGNNPSVGTRWLEEGICFLDRTETSAHYRGVLHREKLDS